MSNLGSGAVEIGYTFVPPDMDPLPFSFMRLAPESIDLIVQRLDYWSKEYGLGDRSFRIATTAYVEYCAPESPTPCSVEIVTDYVAWFFWLNDMAPGPAKVDEIRDARKTLEADRSSSGVPITPTAMLRRRIDELWPSDQTRRLYRWLDRLLESFAWELEQESRLPPTGAYIENRDHTIANYPFVELWRLGEGVFIPEYLHAPVERLGQLCNECVYLVNDLLSVQRDKRKGKFNIVFCLARDKGIDLETASGHAIERLTRAVNDFLPLQRDVLSDQRLDAAFRKYVEYLGSLIEGNRAATVALPGRFLGID